MSMISGKRKKTATENNEIAPGTFSESGYMFFYKHNVYKHNQPQFGQKK